MDFYISIYTLNKFDNILNTYKKNILKDFYSINDLSIDYETFEKNILDRKINKPIIKSLDKNKCHSYIWKKHYGKIQCTNNHSVSNFCKKHYLKQNYGIINFSY